MKQNLKTESGKQAVWFATRSPEDCKPIFEALVKSLVALSDIGNFEYLAKVEFESPKEGVKFPMDPSILECLVGTGIKIDWSKYSFDTDQMNKVSFNSRSKLRFIECTFEGMGNALFPYDDESPKLDLTLEGDFKFPISYRALSLGFFRREMLHLTNLGWSFGWCHSYQQ